MKQSYLAFEIGSMQKTVYPLLGPTTIGRSADNTITLPDPTTSRNHAAHGLVDHVDGFVLHSSVVDLLDDLLEPFED